MSYKMTCVDCNKKYINGYRKNGKRGVCVCIKCSNKRGKRFLAVVESSFVVSRTFFQNKKKGKNEKRRIVKSPTN